MQRVAAPLRVWVRTCGEGVAGRQESHGGWSCVDSYGYYSGYFWDEGLCSGVWYRVGGVPGHVQRRSLHPRHRRVLARPPMPDDIQLIGGVE